MKLLGVFIINMDCQSKRMSVLDIRHIVPIKRVKISKNNKTFFTNKKRSCIMRVTGGKENEIFN